MIEILRSLPELPLWLALSAALPPNWSPILVFFGITIILGLLDWPGLARAVRSKLLSLREEDFVKAAELMGASKRRIIARHLIPNFMSHLIASATLSIPSMILGETALSFLGLGLRPPVTSWGVLLNEAQNLAAVQLHPWLLFPDPAGRSSSCSPSTSWATACATRRTRIIETRHSGAAKRSPEPIAAALPETCASGAATS